MRDVLSIQYLRAVAATMVVVYHVFNWMLTPAAQDTWRVAVWASGVDVFFVISGYIMWTTTSGRDVGPSAFWRARLVRIAPLYWLALVVYWCVLAREVGVAAAPDGDEVVRAMAFMPYHDRTTGLIGPYLTAGWTLTHEMIFYAIFGAALIIENRVARFAVVAVVFAGMVAARGLVDATDPWGFRLTSPLVFEFLAGMAAAAVMERFGRHRSAPVVGTVLIGVAVGFALLLSRPHFDAWPRILDFGFPAAALVAGTLAFEERLRRRPIGWLKAIGDASYSLYLVNEIWQRLAGPVVTATGAPAWLQGTILFAGSMICGLAVHRVVERPLTAWIRTSGRRDGSAAPAPSPAAPA